MANETKPETKPEGIKASDIMKEIDALKKQNAELSRRVKDLEAFRRGDQPRFTYQD